MQHPGGLIPYFLVLPAAAITETLRDHWWSVRRRSNAVPEVRAAVLDWLCSAQDCSRPTDDGFARHYSLIDGWSSSYPETTGYIIPTLLAEAETRGRADLRERAVRALDWLVAIQYPEGGFQGGLIDSTPKTPVTFNTGQILLGLAAGAVRWPDRYLEPMERAARWLRDSQETDGAWRRHPTPFAAAGDKVYETHVAWGMFEAEAVAPGQGFAATGMKNVRWALSRQQPNGWFADCCLEDSLSPLTHTIGYTLRGIIAGWHHTGDDRLLAAAVRSLAALEGVLRPDGSMPGRLGADWQGTVRWTCLTGNVQIAECWALLADAPGATDTFRQSAERAVRFVRETIRVTGPDGIRGGVKGSVPVTGRYGWMSYLNWAAKFYLDAERALERVVQTPARTEPPSLPVAPA